MLLSPRVWVALAVLAAPAKPDTLHYRAEWRLIHAGNARLTYDPAPPDSGVCRQADLHLESVGLVSKLHRIRNTYSTLYGQGFCTRSTFLHAEEGRKRRETSVTFDGEARKASYLERDLLKDAVVSTREIEIPACVHDVIAGLLQLRTMQVPLKQTVQMPVSDGKKFAEVRVEAQAVEKVSTPAGEYAAIRYEAFLFNDVIFRRKGHLYVWLTDDQRRLPVQIRIRLPFYIGTVTLGLVKEEKP